MIKMFRRLIIILLAVLLLPVFAAENTPKSAYSKKQQEFVCFFWETLNYKMDRLQKDESMASASLSMRKAAFKQIMAWGDEKIKSPDCPKLFRENWQFYSANFDAMLMLGMKAMMATDSLQESERKFLQKIDASTQTMQKIYDECKKVAKK